MDITRWGLAWSKILPVLLFSHFSQGSIRKTAKTWKEKEEEKQEEEEKNKNKTTATTQKSFSGVGVELGRDVKKHLGLCPSFFFVLFCFIYLGSADENILV